MLVSEIKLDTTQLIDTASNIRTYSKQMKKKTEEMQKIMSGLQESYDTESTHEVLKKYREIESKLTKMYDALSHYSEFLETSAEYYEKVENQLSQSARDTADRVISSIGHLK